MGFFIRLTDAIASNRSLLVAGLDPNPEMLQSWAHRRGMGGRSFLSQARHWIKAVIEATADQVCAYKPSLGFYQALGPIGLELLREVRELVPLSMPLIVDAKHGDLNSSSALAHHLFRDLGADAVTLSPLPGQDIAAPFLLYPEKAVVVTCHSSNPAARVVQHHPDPSDPLFLRIVRECQLWATPEQLLLEVGTSDPAILAQVRGAAPERFLILRSLWAEEDRLDALLEAGLGAAGDGLLLPLPQNLLVEDDIAEQSATLRQRIETKRQQWLTDRRRRGDDHCQVWLPQGPEPGAAATSPAVGAPRPESTTANANDPISIHQGTDESLEALIVDLFDIGCLLFGDYVQASGAIFHYYIDLRQIISDPNLFHRVLHAYANRMAALRFDRIAGIPYGSLPTATGLSLNLRKPLIYPRKEVKAHGARRLIEGDFQEGDRVIVVDDIVISGGSLLDGIGKLEHSGLTVEDVVVFIDHGGEPGADGLGGRQRLEAAGYRCHAVVDILTLTDVLHRHGRLNKAQAQLLQTHP